MKTIHKFFCIPFWLAALMVVLGWFITFMPGAECGWFLIAATLSLFGLFIPKIFYRSGAILLIVISILAAVHGYQRGMKYWAGAPQGVTIRASVC